MRLFLLGATGRTGSALLTRALCRGHDVTAFVRSPHKLSPQARLHIVQGDPRDTAAQARAMSEARPDAVLSAIGPAARDAFSPSTLLTDCAASTVAAMTTAGTSRLAIVSAAMLSTTRGAQLAFMRWFLRHHVRDLATMEAVVKASGLAFTVARPPRLIDVDDDQYRSCDDAMPARFRATSFKAVAAFLLDAVERETHVGALCGVSR
jgi:putative NADH-flavin reductase